MTRGRRTWHRRAFAATAALLWLLGVEVLPNLHLATHQHDHTHAVDGSIVQLGHAHEASEPPHAHHDVAHHHPHDDGGDHGAAHEHHDDELAALQVAHEHVVIVDDVALIERLYDGVEHDNHDADAAEIDAPAPAERVAPRKQRRRDRTQLAIDKDVAPGHAALGIAHHATALHKPAPPRLAPVATPNVESWTYAAPNERISSAELARPTARGPPVA